MIGESRDPTVDALTVQAVRFLLEAIARSDG
jgi:hypothetical protein